MSSDGACSSCGSSPNSTEKNLWIGIGCKQGASRHLIESAIQQICQIHGLEEGAIAGLATLDRKTSQVGLIELCRDRHWLLQGFPSDRLQAIAVPHPSRAVAERVGTSSVAEAAAMASAQAPLRVTKTVVRDGDSVVTVAIAQSAESCDPSVLLIDPLLDPLA